MSLTLAKEEFDDDDFQTLQELHDALLPVKILTEKLCSESANLLSADAAFVTTLKWLRIQKGQFSKDLCTKLEERYVHFICVLTFANQ